MWFRLSCLSGISAAVRDKPVLRVPPPGALAAWCLYAMGPKAGRSVLGVSSVETGLSRGMHDDVLMLKGEGAGR